MRRHQSALPIAGKNQMGHVALTKSAAIAREDKTTPRADGRWVNVVPIRFITMAEIVVHEANDQPHMHHFAGGRAHASQGKSVGRIIDKGLIGIELRAQKNIVISGSYDEGRRGA